MNFRRTMLVGTLWAMAMRWGIRGLGMISVIVLARLLLPEDIAIVAMAMILVGAMAILTEVGVWAMLIRDKEVTREDLDTAFTIKVIQGFVAATLVALFAHPLANYFDEPRLVDVVYVCAIALVLTSFENIGVVMFRRELNFSKDFRYEVVIKLVGVLVTIPLAFWLRNYWALVIGKVVTSLAEIAFSYGMHPFRPRFSLARWRRFVGFSFATMLTSAASFVSSKASQFIVSSVDSAASMGAYNMAYELASVAPSELQQSVSRTMFPALAQSKSDPPDLARKFLQVLGTVAMMVIPMGLGIWAVADDLVPVLLGDKWDQSRDLIKYLALTGMLASLNSIMLGPILIITRHHQRQAFVQWVRCGVIVTFALAGSAYGVNGIAAASTLAGLTILLFSTGVLRMSLACRLGDFVRIFWRPVLSALIMAAAVRALALHVDLVPILRLALCIVIGILTYVGALYTLWAVSGTPRGPEEAALTIVSNRLRRKR